LLCVPGDMYQHFEVTTPGIRLLQEATDKALDTAAGTAAGAAGASKHHSHHKQHSTAAAAAAGKQSKVGPADPEGGPEGQAGMTDWQELKQQLEAGSWSGWFSKVAGRCGLKTLGEATSRREVSLGTQTALHLCFWFQLAAPILHTLHT